MLSKDNVAQMKHVDHIINELEVLHYLYDLNIQDDSEEDQGNSKS